MNNTLCPYPWYGIAVRPDGLVLPCCQFNDDSINTFNSNIKNEDPRNNANWQKIRELQFNNEKVKGCNICYDAEKQNIKSLRQMAFDKLPKPIDTTVNDLIFLEISFSNLCNLACIHCDDFFSTRWYQENHKAGRTIKTKILKHDVNIEDNLDLSKVKYLKIIGGEPMMEQDRFINLLDRLNLEECSIQVCTNGYILPNAELETRLIKAKKLLIVISLDGIDSVNDWCRYPSKWAVFKDMIEKYDIKYGNKPNIYLHFHCCIGIYNIFYLKELVDFVLQTKSNFKLEWDWISNPSWQAIHILPESVKNDLKKYFIRLSKNLHPNDLKILCDVDPFQSSIMKLNEYSNENDWNICKEKTKMFAKERNLDLNSLIPRFFELIK